MHSDLLRRPEAQYTASLRRIARRSSGGKAARSIIALGPQIYLAHFPPGGIPSAFLVRSLFVLLGSFDRHCLMPSRRARHTAVHINEPLPRFQFRGHTLNSYCHASSSSPSPISHSSGSSSKASRSVDVRGSSLSMSKRRAERTKSGVKTACVSWRVLCKILRLTSGMLR